MARESYQVVLRLRKHGVDAARTAVAEAIGAADKAHHAVRDLERQIETERRRATDIAGEDGLVEAFAAWLPESRRQVHAARTEHDRLSAELARRRAELGRAEVALETIETLLRRRAVEATASELRRCQVAIDEAAARVRNRRS